ncbi:MAG TPA: radical SAM protein [Blastocatellia bacterium]|nr:radical SAM protein [Blastocatellia bacterium]
MSGAISESLSETLFNHLLEKTPDPTLLQTKLMSELDLSESDGREVLYQVVKQVNRQFFPPITQLEIIHTEGCNLGCTYCFERNMLGYKKMPADVAYASVDLLFDYSFDEHDLTLTHFGGEPTLNFPGIQLVTEYAEKKAAAHGKTITFNMTTNGILINETMANYFAQHRIMVLLSIDGLESTHDRYRVDKGGHGTFKRVLRALNILKRSQSWIGIKMTVMPENVDYLFNDVRGLYDLGVNHFIIGHATGIPWSSEAMACYERRLGELFSWYRSNPHDDLRIDGFDEDADDGFFGCQAARTSVAVAISGEISPCSKIMGLNSKELIGKLGDIRYGIFCISNRTALVGCSQLKSACEEEGIAESYQGGCFAVNQAENGDMFRPSLQEHRISMLKRSACAGCSGCH